MAALDLLDARHHAVARQRAVDEDDDALMACDTAPTRCERVDGELELLSDPKRRSHVRQHRRGAPSRAAASAVPSAAAGERGEHAEAGRDGRREPQAAIALGVGQRAERDGRDRAAAEERRRHQRDGLTRARRARDLAGDQVEHAVEAERAEAEHDQGGDPDGGSLGPHEPTSATAAAHASTPTSRSVATRRRPPPASARRPQPMRAAIALRLTSANSRLPAPRLAPPSRSAGHART